VALPEDPSARVGVAADRLDEALAALDPPAPEAVTRALAALRRALALEERARRGQRTADLRGALDDADRRAADVELLAERRASAEKIAQLSREIEALLEPTRGGARDLYRKYEGKVRDNYTHPDGRRYIVVTDRISAFDRVLGTLPLKGQV
jgi:cell division protein ZapA (FtsZ GTPase activity inhibitor)